MFLLALAATPLSAAEPALLSLDRALERAYANNPDLAAARWEIDIAQGARQQAGLLPNPLLSVDAEDTRRDSRTTSVKLSQALELGGKRGARVELASRDQELANLELERRRTQLRADVLEAYYAAQLAQQRQQLARRSLALAERGLAVAQGRVRGGKAAPLEATRAQVQLAEVNLELKRGQLEQDNAYRQLARVIGSASADFTAVQEAPSIELAPPPAARLLERLQETSELRMAEQEIVQREAALGLQRAQRIADLDVSIGSQYDAGARERVNLVGLSMPLPLFNRNQGNVLSATRRADQARDLRNAAQLRLRDETLQALAQWNTARGEAQSFDQTLLPAAQRAVESATRGFEMGKFGFLEVLDAQRTLISARSQYLAALAQSSAARVRIERIYGDLERW